MVTSLRLRSSADIVKETTKNQVRKIKNIKIPCDRHPAQSFRFYIVLFRCDSPHRGSVGTVIQSSPLIRPVPFLTMVKVILHACGVRSPRGGWGFRFKPSIIGSPARETYLLPSRRVKVFSSSSLHNVNDSIVQVHELMPSVSIISMLVFRQCPNFNASPCSFIASLVVVS